MVKDPKTRGVSPTRTCCHCGYAFKGRGIIGGHNLADYNLMQHEAACLGQRARKEAKRVARACKLAGVEPPLPGQLPLPEVEGVEEVPR